MKINQLFNNVVDDDVLSQVLECFGLVGFSDKKSFKKQDLIAIQTVQKLNALKDVLKMYYMTCKANIYLENLTEKKSITILRQIVRLFNYHIASKERNINNKKVIYYVLESDKDLENINVIKTQQHHTTLFFD